MADLELRLVRYFVVVAEQRNFLRAAEALHVAQPSLSRQVRRLEQQLGVRLLDRTPQGSRLTAAGEVFLPRARALLRSAEQAAADARAAAEPLRFVVGHTGGLEIAPAVHELRRRHPEADVQTLALAWNDAHVAVLDGRVDAAVTRLPIPVAGLIVTPLYDEPRALLVPAGHRLAGKESAVLDDIAGEPVPRVGDETWNAFWRVDPRPDGRRAPEGPFVSGLEDKLELIAAGQAVAIVPAAVPQGLLRPDLALVPLRDIEPGHVVLATRAGDRGSLGVTFSIVALAHLRSRI
jgi:DNA-binding transcriptional LysR family regulator